MRNACQKHLLEEALPSPNLPSTSCACAACMTASSCAYRSRAAVCVCVCVCVCQKIGQMSKNARDEVRVTEKRERKEGGEGENE